LRRLIAFLTDQVLRLAYDYVTASLYPNPTRPRSERLLLLAVGGYGRGEMALHSDVDIALVTPDKRVAWTEQVVEALLYLLWDLGLKVGHSTRSLHETIRTAKADQTVRTALLEMRYLWGDEALFDEVSTRFWGEVVAGTAQAFVADKLEERNARHLRMGDSRYVVEPNVKEGKGGLRDLHTLFWIGKYAYRVRSVPELVEAGLLRPGELRQFQKAERFLWAVRCHLHIIAGRAEERLTFDYQREIAARMNYADRPGKSPVERFMRHYFLHAKTVGDLTGLSSRISTRSSRTGGRFGLPRSVGARASWRLRARSRPARFADRGFPGRSAGAADPAVRAGARHGLEIHPLRCARRAARPS
jgi:[protein-PII] uridylyltransferase